MSGSRRPGGLHVAVVGAGIAGLATALALGRSGHRITIFERDPIERAEDPTEAFEQERRGAPHTRHSHVFLARLRNLLRDRYPDVLDELRTAGAAEMPFVAGLPSSVECYEPDPSDEDLTLLGCRRSTFEWALLRCVLAIPGVTIRTAEVHGLTGSPQRVTGVYFDDGTEEMFDLVVVAGGRRSAVITWLDELGSPPVPEFAVDAGIVLFSRHYRLKYGREMPLRVAIGQDLGYLKYGVFPGDDGTFSITLASVSTDAEMGKLLDDEVRFDAAGRMLGVVAPYLDGRADPISGVHKFVGVVSRWRDYVVGNDPISTGVFAVGDAIATTNPMYGRGCTTAFWSAELLNEALNAHPGDVRAAALAYNAKVSEQIRPWVLATIETDADANRLAAAVMAGRDPGVVPFDAGSIMWAVGSDAFPPALRNDIYVLRALRRNVNLLTPPSALADDPDFRARVLAACSAPETRPPEPSGRPTRDQLVQRLRSLRLNSGPVRTPILAGMVAFQTSTENTSGEPSAGSTSNTL